MSEPHRVELFKREFNFATTYGWQCLDCDAEDSGASTVAEAEEGAKQHSGAFPTAAERECDQLRADNDRWREQGTAWVDQHVALARENDQLRAERDRLREVVLAIRDSGVAHPLILEAIGTAAGLLDDEGQAHG